jgi:hypothetical protein
LGGVFIGYGEADQVLGHFEAGYCLAEGRQGFVGDGVAAVVRFVVVLAYRVADPACAEAVGDQEFGDE